MAENDAFAGNRAEVVIGGRLVEIAGTNRALKLYRDEAIRDMALAQRDGAHEATIAAAATPIAKDKDGKPFQLFSGNLVADALAEYELHHAPAFFTWMDIPHTLCAIWAMGTAAGSIRRTWPKFYEDVADSSAFYGEAAAAQSVIFQDLAPRTFLRALGLGGGEADAAPDASGGAQAAEADRRGDSVAS